MWGDSSSAPIRSPPYPSIFTTSVTLSDSTYVWTMGRVMFGPIFWPQQCSPLAFVMIVVFPVTGSVRFSGGLKSPSSKVMIKRPSFL